MLGLIGLTTTPQELVDEGDLLSCLLYLSLRI